MTYFCLLCVYAQSIFIFFFYPWDYPKFKLKYIVKCRAPDKLRICVFYAMKTSKNACIIRSECTITHTY